MPKATSKSESRTLRRVKTLIGITGARLAKYRPGWKEVSSIWVRLTWRPHVFGILLFEVRTFDINIFLALSPDTKVVHRPCSLVSALEST